MIDAPYFLAGNVLFNPLVEDSILLVGIVFALVIIGLVFLMRTTIPLWSFP
jgi:hypothetical protein